MKSAKDTVKDKKTAEDAAAKIKPQTDKINDLNKRFAALKLDDKAKKELGTKYAGENAQAIGGVATAMGRLSELMKTLPPDGTVPLLPGIQATSEVLQAISKE